MALEIAIDTNRYRDFMDGIPEAVSIFKTASLIHVPFIVAAELRAGFAVGSRGKENGMIFENFLHRERVTVLFAGMETTRHYANLFRQLRAAGTPIPTNDIWIASLVIQYELTLFSRDNHFAFIPQIIRV